MVGQQVSVRSARTTLTRLLTAAPVPQPPVDHEVDGDVELQSPGHAHDRPGLRGFLRAEEVAGLPDSAFGMPAGRRETVRALARAVASGEIDLDPGGDREEVVRRLTAVPGIGPWTAGYVAMRALGDPDVLLPTDLAVRRGAAALGLPTDPKTLDTHAERWRPWRSYAVIRLWRAA